MQEMSARIGMVTSQGLTQTIKQHYPKPLLFFIVLLMVPAIFLNIAADIASMGAVSNLVFLTIPASIFSVFFTIVLMITIILLPYTKIVVVLKYFCLSLFFYLIIPFLSRPDWLNIVKNTLIPTIQFNKEFLSILVALLGTTISPYMFFWQATMAAEDKKKERITRINIKRLKEMRYDVLIGMFASNLVMYFIIMTTGTILFQHGITKIETVEQAAKALEPLAGKFAYLLFTLGILGTGALAIPVLSGSLSYILSTFFNLKCGLDKPFYQTKGFYIIIIVSMLLALLINFIGINPINALLWTAIFYGITAPVMILLVLHVSNNKTIMKNFTNGKTSNILGGSTFILMFFSAISFLYVQFF